jgi:8-oxo-dGTP pyrophosphatase MutT (NUDIX family)
MQVVYSDQEAPPSFTKSIFLAGPTPRSADVPSWRPEALRILEQLGFEGVVFVPEYSTGKPHDYNLQVEWEKKHLTMADVILFWVPRELQTMPAFTTNVEFGTWIDSRKVVFGAPPGAKKNTYLKWLYRDRQYGEPHEDLTALCKDAIAQIGDGELRTGAERYIQAEIWKSHPFQDWYAWHRQQGNELHDAKVLFRWDVKGKPHSFVLWAKVYIAAENRFKENEFVVFRPDTVNVVAYLPAEDFLDTKVVLVREFRTAVRNPECYVVELPGGSSWNLAANLREIAVAELAEETGIEVDPERLVPLGGRQLAATMLAQHAFVYGLELTQGEFDNLSFSATFGVTEDTERTTVRVRTVRELLAASDVDWSMLGMVFRGCSGCTWTHHQDKARPLTGSDTSS